MKNQRILVVDDEPFIIELCQRFLTAAGYTVQTALSGEEALRLFKPYRPDLVLTDIRMPGMNGLELIQEVKQQETNLAIVVITGHGTLSTAIETMKEGVLGFVIKPFTEDELLSAVKQALEKAALVKENMRLRSLMPLFEASKSLVSELNLDRLLDNVVAMVKKETNADRVSIMLLDPVTKSLTVKAFVGFPTIIPQKLHRVIGNGIAGRVAQTGQPLFIDRAQVQDTELADFLKDEDISSALSVPLISQGITTGVLNVAMLREGQLFTQSDLELVSILAGQAAAAVENAKLYQKTQLYYRKTIEALVTTLEIKDPYTKGHSIRVQKWACAIADVMHLSPEDTETVRMSGLLHDIGKIGSSEEILLKEARLTPEEFERMKQHPRHSAKILGSAGLSEEIIQSVLHHHEWYNGKGYPDGLSNKQIPLASRILLVADAVDAMSSDRPYRKALPLEKLQTTLKEYSGTQFDPEIVEAVLQLLSQQGLKVVRSDGYENGLKT
ncbi:MAG TPA: HD domain-containing phosphohydrolase [Nitrospiria bacterium]|jgi:putative nucleotidyltransferase with HDIG domain|nr:HD domain-containing phosphohydrolase [Nitrospiria bacterium]